MMHENYAMAETKFKYYHDLIFIILQGQYTVGNSSFVNKLYTYFGCI